MTAAALGLQLGDKTLGLPFRNVCTRIHGAVGPPITYIRGGTVAPLGEASVVSIVHAHAYSSG